jgi:hypothetical protein
MLTETSRLDLTKSGVAQLAWRMARERIRSIQPLPRGAV